MVEGAGTRSWGTGLHSGSANDFHWFLELTKQQRGCEAGLGG